MNFSSWILIFRQFFFVLGFRKWGIVYLNMHFCIHYQNTNLYYKMHLTLYFNLFSLVWKKVCYGSEIVQKILQLTDQYMKKLHFHLGCPVMNGRQSWLKYTNTVCLQVLYAQPPTSPDLHDLVFEQVKQSNLVTLPTCLTVRSIIC